MTKNIKPQFYGDGPPLRLNFLYYIADDIITLNLTPASCNPYLFHFVSTLSADLFPRWHLNDDDLSRDGLPCRHPICYQVVCR